MILLVPVSNPYYPGYYLERGGRIYTAYTKRKNTKGWKSRAEAAKLVKPWDRGYSVVHFDGVKIHRNPRKRKSSFRTAYENAAQRERLGKWLATSGRSGHGQRIAKRAAKEKEGYRRARQKGIISTVRRNPSFINYDTRAANKQYIVEALVRTAGTNRFSYGFWTGNAFAKSRGSAEKFASQSTALAAAKRILPLLPSKILSLRAVPA